MITLTAPNGMHIEVNPALVGAVSQNVGDFHPNAKSVVVIDGVPRGVQETVEEIETLINKG